MVYRFHSVMEIKRHLSLTPELVTREARYFKETIQYDIAGQKLHRLEIDWLRPRTQIELILYTFLFLLPALIFTALPSLLIGAIIKNFAAGIAILCLSSFAASYWFSRIIMVEKKMKALIRRERGLEQKNDKFALVAEKRWAAWLLKLKPL